MIENEYQYNLTKNTLATFEQALVDLHNSKYFVSNINPVSYKAEKESLINEINKLRRN